MSGRSDDRLAKYKTRLQRKVQELVRRQGWVPAGVLGAVLSLQLDLGGLNSSVVRVRGHVTACHQSPVCLDLACGRCFDPLTSVHADCGLHSYFKCEDLLPEACLPWTCAKTSRTQRPLLRNFLPRTAACTTSASSLNLVAPGSEDNVTLIGLGLTLSALTACSEEPVCWDEDCSLCYDPLEQSHAPCPAPLTTHSCSHLPLPCRPFLCWPRQANLTSQADTVLLRDFARSLGAC